MIKRYIIIAILSFTLGNYTHYEYTKYSIATMKKAIEEYTPDCQWQANVATRLYHKQRKINQSLRVAARKRTNCI